MSIGLLGRRVSLPARSELLAWVAPRAIAFAFWIVLPLVCAAFLAYGTDRLATHLNNIPPGVPGTYLVTSHSCNENVCVTGGTFTSADGKLVETNLLGNYSWQNGEKHRAIYDSTSVDVIPLPAHWDPSPTYVGMGGSLGFVILWSVFLFGAIRRRIDARAERAWSAMALA